MTIDRLTMDEKSPLTEDEAELYDRQIRLWGIESQARLCNAKVLVIGMGGLGAEVVKNIVLSGVKLVKMVDDRLATEEDLDCQFLIPPESLNKNRAEGSQARAQALNPLVTVLYDKASSNTFLTDKYIEDFNLVICLDQDHSVNLKMNELCRNKSSNMGFVAGGVYGTFGFVFEDLKVHIYTVERPVSVKAGSMKKFVTCSVKYPTLTEALSEDLSSLAESRDFKTSKMPASIFLYKILLKFEEKHGRRPSDSEDDVTEMLALKPEVLGNLTTERLPDTIFRCVSTKAPSPICAILGAVIAQEAVKIISRKAVPIRNFFFFDPLFLAGHQQYVGPDLSSASSS